MKKITITFFAIVLSLGVLAQQNTTIAMTGCNLNTPGWGESLGEVRFSWSDWARNPELYHNRVIRDEAGQPIQLWSSPVEAENCRKETFDGGNARRGFNADCRYNPRGPGSLFSWCAITRFAEELCPYPWRVPTVEDFITLDRALGGTGSAQRTSRHHSMYRNTWGFTTNVSYVDGRGRFQGRFIAGAYFWSASERNATEAFTLSIIRDAFRTNPQNHALKSSGFRLRCIRTDEGMLEVVQHLAKIEDSIRAENEAREAQRAAQREAQRIEQAHACNNNVPGWGESLGTVTFKTDRTWTVGDQEWSDVVMASSCSEKTTFLGGTSDGLGLFRNLNADCRSNHPGFGDLFSWCAVYRFRDELCPDGWRVPTRDDFIALDRALGGGIGREHSISSRLITESYLNPEVWGGSLSGFSLIDGRLGNWPPDNYRNAYQNVARYWSQTEFVETSHGTTHRAGYFFFFTHPRAQFGARIGFRENPIEGVSIRCVR